MRMPPLQSLKHRPCNRLLFKYGKACLYQDISDGRWPFGNFCRIVRIMRRWGVHSSTSSPLSKKYQDECRYKYFLNKTPANP